MPRYRNTANDVRIETESPLTSRRLRSPQHTWFVTLRPWVLQPVLCAPVLPGETLKNASIQCRVVSDPVANLVTGWWLEFYLFYVRVGDLPATTADQVRKVASDPAASFTGLTDAADPNYYHAQSNYASWLKKCTEPVVRAYFRREGEEWNASGSMVGTLPIVAVTGTSILDSVHLASEVGAGTGADTWAQQWSVYQNMRAAKLTTNTFEEWLAKYGVNVGPQLTETIQPKQDDFRIPELLRFVRDFAFPTPNVDPQSGALAATLQWSLAERVDKSRFFAEPGWVVGYMTARPKVNIWQNLRTAQADVVQDGNTGFMQPDFDTDPHTSLVKVANGATTGATSLGPVYAAAAVGDYWFDRRDLFLHGDQFTNGDPASGTNPHLTVGNRVAMPRVGLGLADLKYPATTDMDNMFVATSTKVLRADGIISFRIASRIGTDTTS